MRLIDADAKIEAELYDAEHEEWILKEMTVVDYLSLTYSSIPFVDAIPVRHGHWDNKITDARFDVPHTVARCSNCKGKIWVYAENHEVKYPYCPLCGAKMDEVTDGQENTGGKSSHCRNVTCDNMG